MVDYHKPGTGACCLSEPGEQAEGGPQSDLTVVRLDSKVAVPNLLGYLRGVNTRRRETTEEVYQCITGGIVESD